MDVAKAIALGADGVVIGTAEMVAMGCVRCANCESGRGCPRGIATTDKELEPQNQIPIQASGDAISTTPGSRSGASCCIRLDMKDISRTEGQDGPAPIRWNTREDAVMDHANKMLKSRRKITQDPFKYLPQEAEGGCGVVGLGSLEAGRTAAIYCSRWNRCTTAAMARAAAYPPSACARNSWAWTGRPWRAITWSRSRTSRKRYAQELEKEFIASTL